MIRTQTAFCALAALVACGDGAPFDNNVTDPDDGSAGDIPESIASSVTGFSFNPGAGAMTQPGTLRDWDEVTNTFVHRAALDRVYQAYTAQDDPLDEHTTVYVRTRGDVSDTVGVTGGQLRSTAAARTTAAPAGSIAVASTKEVTGLTKSHPKKIQTTCDGINLF